MPVAEAVFVLRAVAVVLGELLTAVMHIKEKAAMFKRTLDALQSTLISLSPVIKDMERLNDLLGRPKEELQWLIRKMEDGTKLVNDCSKVHRLNCVSRCRYQAELNALEDWFLKHFGLVVIAQIMRDQKEILRHQILNREGRNLLHPEHEEVHRVSRYFLTARNLYIAWGDTPTYWTWTSSSHESFPEVAELVGVCWLEIRGWIKTSLLPSNKRYEAYFVFSKSSKGTSGFHDQAVEVSLKVVGEEGDGQRQMGYLESKTPPNRTYDAVARPALPEAEPVFEVKLRTDGLLEVKLGEFFARDGEDREVEMGVHEVKKLWWKRGIIVQGIEIRTR